MIEDDELRQLFQAESEERIRSLEEGFRKLEENSRDKEVIESAFRDAHTIKSSARMLQIQSIESLAHALENRLDAVRKGEQMLSFQSIQILYDALDAIQSLVKEAVEGSAANVRVDILIKRLNVESSPTAIQKVPEPLANLPQPQQRKDGPPNILEKPSPPLPPSPPPSQEQEKILPQKEPPFSISTVRINMQQISDLIDQTVDLTVVKNRIIQLLEKIEDLLDKWQIQSHAYQQSAVFNSSYPDISKDHSAFTKQSELFKEIGEHFKNLHQDAYHDLQKLESIASTFADHVRKLSLLPLSKLFDFFPRMVRELAQEASKTVELRIEGGDIAVDKAVIEHMKDPLMHLLRNAVSHGIELPAEREQKGKSAKGLIQLIGRQTANSIFIEIFDDGRGLDVEKIKAVAMQRNLISEPVEQHLTPSEINALIFLPGFSTTSEVSSISGRGVGLDVVKTEVEKLHGTITTHSEHHQGTSFSIELPITHFSTQVILVEANQRIYALPTDIVETCFYLPADQVDAAVKNAVIFVHEEPLPLVFLNQWLEGVNSVKEGMMPSSCSCIILKVKDKKSALIVDNILDEQKVVITPLNPILIGLKGVLGATILKTGEVCLILNPMRTQPTPYPYP